MIEYILEKENNYFDEIIDRLNNHNKEFIENNEKENRSFYVLNDNDLVGVMNVYYNWDWVIITGLFYKNIEVLQDMLVSMSKEYEGRVLGVHYRTYESEKLNDFTKLGFKSSCVIDVNDRFDTMYYLDMETISFKSEIQYEVASR